MRIGVVTTSYPREPGDPAGQFVAGLTRWLSSLGHDLDVVAAGPGAARIDGLPVTRVDGRGLFYAGGAPDALDGARGWRRAASFTGALAATVARRVRGWDGVVSHWVAPSGIVAATLAGRRPHLAIAHSSDVALLRRSVAGRAALRSVARRAQLVYAAPHLVLDGAPGRVAPMGIDVRALSSGDRARGRAALGLDAPTALFLGRLVPVKGLDLLLAALPDGVTLLVAGAGPREAAWRALAARRGAAVRFLGEVRGRDTADLLAASDLLVVPSLALGDGRSEGTPTVLFEAHAAGLPVIATRTGGIAAALTDGKDALLVAPEAGELRAAIERLVADRPLRARLAAAGRAAAAQRDWSCAGPRIVGSWLETVSRA